MTNLTAGGPTGPDQEVTSYSVAAGCNVTYRTRPIRARFDTEGWYSIGYERFAAKIPAGTIVAMIAHRGERLPTYDAKTNHVPDCTAAVDGRWRRINPLNFEEVEPADSTPAVR